MNVIIPKVVKARHNEPGKTYRGMLLRSRGYRRLSSVLSLLLRGPSTGLFEFLIDHSSKP